MVESHIQRNSWPNIWVGGKFDFIPHNLHLELSMALVHRLKKSGFLGWFLFLHTQLLSLKQFCCTHLASNPYCLLIPHTGLVVLAFHSLQP